MKTTDFLNESDYSQEEYSDEAGMVKDNLHTIIRAMTDLCREIKDNEDIPEWAQEKIAQAKGMLVSVKDYMVSQHEQGIQPQVDECTSGATGAGGIATSMGGGDGFGQSIFYKQAAKETKKKSRK